MKSELQDELAKHGWILTNKDLKPPFMVKDEIKGHLAGLFVSIMAFIPLLLALILLAVTLKFKKKNKKPRILFGPHIVVTFKLIKEAVEEDFDCTIFIYDDYSQRVENLAVVTAKDIMPGWIANKYMYSVGRYFAFIWALKNFDIVHHYFNSGFLDKTLWWRLEPIIYQLFDKKIILIPHGADVWDIFRNSNRLAKLGHMSRPGYFDLDFKRIRRVYWWSKYATLIFGTVNYMDFLPRIDILILHGHMLNQKTYNYAFPEDTGKVKIIHYANDYVRKGSYFIMEILNIIKKERDDFEFEIYEKLPRYLAMEKLDEAHIFIEQITDGFLSLSAVEAMLKGKVVLANIDMRSLEFYKYFHCNYFVKHFNELPVININQNDFKDKLVALLDDKKGLRSLSIRSRKFAEKLVADNKEAYKLLISSVVNSYQNENSGKRN